jgi:signal transduction histidine kinase
LADRVPLTGVLVEVWTDLDWLLIRIKDKGKGFKAGEISPGSSLGL